jgi:tRNA A-37 threonylcarbamoyl transferase component Bud32
MGEPTLHLSHGDDDGFDVDAELRALGAELDDAVAADAGECGPFRLLGVIGEGGYGIVHLAVQRRPIRRRVAVKVLKPGLDSADVLRRFALEQSALARIDHPNVAPIIDAGTTHDGRPWFAMPLLDGEPLVVGCDDAGIGLQDRLRILAETCDGVHAAHVQGIVHRDLKPGNVILIRGSDGRLTPRVIDFGIARAIDATDAGMTRTVDARRLGTPAYMAPEQRRELAPTADTRSDVHALGVILAELLCGSRPDPGTAAPCRPSLTLAARALIDPAGADESARQRSHHDAVSLRRALRGDLDAIVAKATMPEPDARYQSASALAEDLRRALDGRPVLAREPGLGYSMRTIARRHRAAVAVGAASLILLVVALGVAANRAIVAQRQAERAQSETVRALEVSAVLHDILSGIKPAVDRGRDRVLLLELLRQASNRFTASMQTYDPISASRTTAALGDAFIALDEPLEAMALIGPAAATLPVDDPVGHPEVVIERARLKAVLGDALEAESQRSMLIPGRHRIDPRAIDAWREAMALLESVDALDDALSLRCRLRLWDNLQSWPAGVDFTEFSRSLEREIERDASTAHQRSTFRLRAAEFAPWEAILERYPRLLDATELELGSADPLCLRARCIHLMFRLAAVAESQSAPGVGVPAMDGLQLVLALDGIEADAASLRDRAAAILGSEHPVAIGAELWRLVARGYQYGEPTVRDELSLLHNRVANLEPERRGALDLIERIQRCIDLGPSAGSWW